MCPFCQRQNRECPVRERPDGRIVCACGQHAWPSSAVYQETCRVLNLTVVGAPHVWTQGM